MKAWTVGVRALCEFTARSGDLDLRFTPAATAQEGILGHQQLKLRRPEHYEAEVPLSYEMEGLLVRGRADGFDPVSNCLEELKTYRGAFEAIPEHHRRLHQAQAKVYAAMLCQERDLPGMTVSVVYYHVDKHKETSISEYLECADLWAFFEQQCRAYVAWGRQEQKHRLARDQACTALQFPYEQFRAGQRQLAVAAFRAQRDAQCLLAQAPTGIGKTLAVVFPGLKAMPEAGLDKLFYLTAKNSGRQMALDALQRLSPDGEGAWRVLEMVARDKQCPNPDKACHGQSCPLAEGFYDRLPAARQQALEQPMLTSQRLQQVANEHQVCPYYLSQEMLRWADAIVGDYNYFFDTHAVLYSQTLVQQWRSAVLVDEAHNLVERARSMYSASFSQVQLRMARKAAPSALKRHFAPLTRLMEDLIPEEGGDQWGLEKIPEDLLEQCEYLAARLGAYVAENPMPQDSPLLQFYFELLYFVDLAGQFGSHSLFDILAQRDGVLLNLRNIVPAPFLAERYGDAHGVVLFSGTMNPSQFYRDVLGLPPSTAELNVASPYRAEQLRVRQYAGLSTRYADRAQSLGGVCDIVGKAYQEQPGNYLLFLSSFDYLEQVSQALQERWPDMPLWHQQPGMSDLQRTQFLDRFTLDGKGVGLAVLGGAFSEGVDLPGKRLIGAFIATLGLPQFNPANESVRQVMARLFGERRAYDYTYLYPGLRKITQAAGRVIRDEQDQGFVYLLDERYGQRRVQQLLPDWWQIEQVRTDARSGQSLR